jgi:hypothetical protein
MMGQEQSMIQKTHRCERALGKQDPAKLGRILRELTLQAYDLLRKVDTSASEIGSGAAESIQALTEVHAKIVQLQADLHAQQLNNLAAYVTVLRERVENGLGWSAKTPAFVISGSAVDMAQSPGQIRLQKHARHLVPTY